MRKIVEYKIVAAEDKYSLQSEIGYLLGKGFELYGELKVLPHSQSYYGLWQVMVKYEDPAPPVQKDNQYEIDIQPVLSVATPRHKEEKTG